MTELQQLVGKTIGSVEVIESYYNEPVTIKISFTDGTYLRIDATGNEDLQWLIVISNLN